MWESFKQIVRFYRFRSLSVLTRKKREEDKENKEEDKDKATEKATKKDTGKYSGVFAFLFTSGSTGMPKAVVVKTEKLALMGPLFVG